MTFNPVSVQQHDGNWQCSVFVADPSTVVVRLIVLDELPTCTTDLVIENKIISGDSVTLTCSLTGAAPPGELVWMKNNTAVRSGHQPLVWTTQITKENKYDIYNCKYQHHTLSPSPTCANNIQFDVQYPPVTSLDIGEGLHTITIGDEFSTVCAVIEANPPASVVWRKESMQVRSSGLLRLQNTEKTDSGEYTCIATNTFYNGQQGFSWKMITIDVQYMPDSVAISHDDDGKAIEHDTLTCTCAADANPSASFIWKDPAQNQIADRATLTLENVQRSNSGIFTYPPIASASISSGDMNGKIRKGEHFSAACVAVYGNPLPTVKWTKDGS
ncbi:transmembrane and immunoglobulin domain-containing protein 1-like [Ptychodera flava]|uniref:transmembrane and immunoglobulin domain-containing protein 1-like n=1 Tax=Ptychodera flava TaxID=63121 RepID=UPI003969FF0C